MQMDDKYVIQLKILVKNIFGNKVLKKSILMLKPVKYMH